MSPNADLLGSWNGTAITGTANGTYEEADVVTPFTGTVTGSNINYSVTFTETPNNLVSQGTYDTSTIIMVDGKTFTENEPGNTFLDAAIATWTRSGQTLTITDDGDIQTFEMIITGNTMTLYISQTETEVDGLETTTTTSNFTVTLSKQ